MTQAVARTAVATGIALAALAGSAAAGPDPDRGRAIVTSRQTGLCLLCHRAPIPEQRQQGDIGPDLAGVGARLTVDELRARIVDPRRFNPESVMPSYARTEGLERVAAVWHGRPLLDAEQIDDVVAWLETLREAPR